LSDLGAARGRIVIDTSDVRRAQGEVQSASRAMTQSLAALGAGVGARELLRFATSAEATATAYRRQSVAARDLAGSQAQLNELLTAYQQATGGAIGKAQALADVTRLQAVGFADSAKELNEFARAARGISIATGQSQDYVISQLQLAIANQSTMRLDQLGLGVSEVTKRVDELRSANSNLTKEMAYQQAVLELATKKFGNLTRSAEAQATGMEKLRKAWDDFVLGFGQATGGGTNAIAEQWANDINRATRELAQFSDLLREAERIGQRMRFNMGLSTFNPDYAGGSGVSDRARGNVGRGSVVTPRFTDDQTSAMVDWHRATLAIERQAGRDRLDATRQYEEQRSSTIREYGKALVRDAEDFARGRARAEQDMAQTLERTQRDIAQREAKQAESLARNLAQAQADHAERLSDMQAELDRSNAERRATSAERVADWEAERSAAMAERRQQSTARLIKLEEDYTKARERAQRDSRERLFDAAARLDAFAIAKEQRRMEQENADRDEARREQIDEEGKRLGEGISQLDTAHRKRLADEAKALQKSLDQANAAYARAVASEGKALQKRIDQANEAYALQLEEARAADAQRLADMQADFILRKRREDEDRAVRLARMAQDHSDQLNEMARQHSLRLTQISEQAQDERELLNEEFQKQLAELGIQTEAWTARTKSITDYAIAEFDRWWARVNEIAKGLAGMGPAPLNPFITPGGFPSLTGGGAGGASTAVTVAPGAIQVFASNSMSPYDVAAEVRTQMELLLREFVSPYRQ
jgi:hypothetical protein